MVNKLLGSELIFIGGAPRSGTSITQAVLDSHSQIFGGPEFDRLPDIVATRNQITNSIKSGRIDMFCSEEQVNNEFGRLIESLLHPVKERNNKKFLSEKTPANVLVFEELLEILPGSKFIHVVRDPRAVINSMLQVTQRYLDKGMQPPEFISDLRNTQNTVKEYVDAGHKAAVKYPERVFTLVYELLVLQPEETTKSLCEFLNINWEEALLHPGIKEHPAEKLLMKDGGIWSGGINKFTDPDPKILTKWGKTLSQEVIKSISEFFGSFEIYKAIGYEL